MPAYSFQEQFVGYIEDESKDHTVRAERAGRNRHARPGEKLYLYFGMRTKWCRKIGEAICTSVERIRITKEDILLDSFGPDVGFLPLTPFSRERFAWADGFRPKHSSTFHPEGAFDLMLQFWRKTHDLPFEGVVIYWNKFKASASSTAAASL